MDPRQAHELFARLKAVSFDPRFKRIRGRYLFVVNGVGEWRVEVDDGRVKVLDGPGDADCVIRCELDDFLRVASGEQNLITGFMQGRIELEGDPALAQQLHGILPSANGRGAQGAGSNGSDGKAAPGGAP